MIDGFAVSDTPLLGSDTCRTYVPTVAQPPFVRCAGGALYVPAMDLSEGELDALIDTALSEKAQLIVRCASTLEEVGRVDAAYGKSPVLLLHACGLLENSVIVSGVYTDKDDLALMAQCGVPLVALPSFDAGVGNGVAPVVQALHAGVQVRLGTADGSFNKSRSVVYEAKVLRLLTNASLNKCDAVTVRQLAAMIADEVTDDVVQAIID